MGELLPFLLSGLVALLGWQTVTLQTISERLARLETEVTFLRQKNKKKG